MLSGIQAGEWGPDRHLRLSTVTKLMSEDPSAQGAHKGDNSNGMGYLEKIGGSGV